MRWSPSSSSSYREPVRVTSGVDDCCDRPATDAAIPPVANHEDKHCHANDCRTHRVLRMNHAASCGPKKLYRADILPARPAGAMMSGRG
jgi:hypothetical protein